MHTCDNSSLCSPSSTPSSMMQNGPTVQDGGTMALGSTMAVAWIGILQIRGTRTELSINYCASDDGLAGEFAFHERLALHLAGGISPDEDIDLDAQLVTGDDRTAELGAL